MGYQTSRASFAIQFGGLDKALDVLTKMETLFSMGYSESTTQEALFVNPDKDLPEILEYIEQNKLN